MRKVTFVIGANATGKSTFIKNNFSEKNVVILNVYDYQQNRFKEAGDNISFRQEFKCLYKANEDLLLDIIEKLKQGNEVVVEQTFFKAKRRIATIDRIRDAIKDDIRIECYVMSPSDDVWKEQIAKRKLCGSFQSYKESAQQIEFPNQAEGFAIDAIYEVVDGKVSLRMDEPKPEIIEIARKELFEEAEKMKKEEDEKKRHLELIESMNSRPFWHYCEVCGKKTFCTAQEAFAQGWDYPPQIGRFKFLGPRTCGDCTIKDTLFIKVHQQEIPIVIESNLTKEELKTWNRIKGEPESLLEEEID